VRHTALLAVLVLGMAGCALSPGATGNPPGGNPASVPAAPTAPGAPPSTTTTSARAAPSAAATAARTHERPTPAPRPTVAGGWRSPVQAVQQFASVYVNWDYRTVSLRLRALSQVSVGQARAMLSTAAAQVGRDYELRRGRIANHGVVEAVAPVLAHDDQYAVVTREQTTAADSNAYQGLAPAWHVALATVTRVRGLWVLSAWQPES
jgi:hypothetical protein